MAKYLLQLTAYYEIGAENIAHARMRAREIRSIGAVFGYARGPHDRDMIPQYALYIAETRKVYRVIGRAAP